MKPVSGKRLAKVLKARGWVLHHLCEICIPVSICHHFLARPGVTATVSVPTHPIHRHKRLRPKTQQSIMNAAGLTDDDL